MYWAASKSQIKTVMSILLLLLSQALGADNVVSAAKANNYDTTLANCSSLSVEPLNFRKFHLSNALHAEKDLAEDWSEHLKKFKSPWGDRYRANNDNCEGNAHQTKVTEMAILVTPQCTNDGRYYAEALWNATDSGYRIEFLYGDLSWYQDSKCRQNNNTVTGVNADYEDGKYKVMVMTQRLGTCRGCSDVERKPDVQIQVNVGLSSSGVIYAAYNSTRNVTENCKQRYIPLKTSEFEEVKVSEDVNKETVSVSVSWYRLDNKDVGYIVAMGDEECTIPNRYPPCVTVKNGTKITIGSMSSTAEELINKKIRIYKIENIDCPHTDIGNELVHLFRGCSDNCCRISGYHYRITQSDIATNDGTNDTQHTGCDSYKVIQEPIVTTETPTSYSGEDLIMPEEHTSNPSEVLMTNETTETPTSDSSNALTTSEEHTSDPDEVLMTNKTTETPTSDSSDSVTTSEEHTSDPGEVLMTNETLTTSAQYVLIFRGKSSSTTVIVAVVVPLVVIIGVILTMLFIISLKWRWHDLKRVHNVNSSDSPTNKASRCENPYTPNYTPTLSSGSSLQSLDTNKFNYSTDTDHESNGQPSCTQTMRECEQERRVLTIYSTNTPKGNQDKIRVEFLTELKSYPGIKVMSHDLTCIKTSPSLWLEREITKATAVLCICNKEFKEDWECPQSAPTSLPLVQSLRHIIAATVNQGKDLSKYAVVLLEPADRNCVPTMYLQSDSRQFMIDDVEDIARFVCDVPTHTILSS